MTTSAPHASTEAHRRLVPCGGHAFDENLVCRCRVSWWTHQTRPQPCRADARRHNCHAHDHAVEPGPS
jgi:hypothetical protein